VPLRHINHGAWLLVTARPTAVYSGTAAEAFCAQTAHGAQRAKEGFRLGPSLLFCSVAAKRRRVGASGSATQGGEWYSGCLVKAV
jgi:hypothetical protein